LIPLTLAGEGHWRFALLDVITYNFSFIEGREMRTIQIVKYVFSIVGLLMLIGAAMLYVRTERFLAEAVHVQGEVIDLVESWSKDSDGSVYKPIVRYLTADDKEVEFVSSMGSYPPAYKVGETVEVLYLPDQPGSAEIKGFGEQWLGVLVLGFLGGIFFCIGAGITLVQWRRNRMNDDLRHKGNRILATYVGVERNTTLEVNGRNPFRVIAQWMNPETSEVHIFNSPNIWFDPTEYVKRDTLSVWIDQRNPKRYLVDISFLPKLAG